jgi:hypothetical protein
MRPAPLSRSFRAGCGRAKAARTCRGASLFAAHTFQRYNLRVPASDPHDTHAEKHRRHAAYAAETTGLLLIAFLLLALTIIRYWHAIRWSLH